MVAPCEIRASFFAAVMLVLVTSAEPGRGAAYDEYDDYDGYGDDINENKEKNEAEGICYVRKSPEAKREPECCPGWERASNEKEEEAYAEDALPTCRPVCSPPCVNGTCEPYNICRCLQGYSRLHNAPKHACQPTCQPPCLNSDCEGPNECRCRPGYSPSRVSNVCRAVVGTQVGATSAPLQLPLSCTPSCVYGRCVATNKCSCHAGYAPVAGRPWECAPHCHSCDSALERCEGPDMCTCVEGYERNEPGKCAPVCETPCYNGRCVAPNECECEDGFVREEDEDICFPTCSPPCGRHGDCVDINKCSCEDGYGLGPDGACIKTCTSEEQWDSVNSQCVPFQTPTQKTSLSSPLDCAWTCVHGACVDAECVCERGWGNEDCGRRCRVLTDTGMVDAEDCPNLRGCSCPRTNHTTEGTLCEEGFEPQCSKDAVTEVVTMGSDIEAPIAERFHIPEWALLVAAVGAGVLMLLLIAIPSAVALHRRHRRLKRLREDDERTRIIKTKDMPCCLIGAGRGRMQDVDLDEWRFIPH